MKLSSAIVAALASVGDAAITCAGTTQLFEVTCDVTDGFKIIVNDNCRKQFFSMVDFENSFIWGSDAVKVMATPAVASATAAATDVVALSTATCTPKGVASTAGSITDSENNAAFQYTSKFSECEVAAPVADNTGTNTKYAYNLYWNSQHIGDTNNPLFQIGQVKFTCVIDPLQEDAGVVKVSEDTAVADPTEVKLDFRTDLSLEVKKFVFDVTAAKDVDALTTVAYPGSQLAYVALTGTNSDEATLGDHMEISLVDGSTAGAITTAFETSIHTCWASTAADPTTNGDSTFDATTAGEFVFFDKFCPVYPDWVGPGAATGYLKESWDPATEKMLTKVHFQQFAFASNAATMGAGTASDIYYHCFIKVCPKGTADCSTKDLDGNAVNCAATSYTPPARRRRSSDESQSENESFELIVSTKVKNVDAEDCETLQGPVCIERKAGARAGALANCLMPATTAMGLAFLWN
jgi:hypothetical protein